MRCTRNLILLSIILCLFSCIPVGSTGEPAARLQASPTATATRSPTDTPSPSTTLAPTRMATAPLSPDTATPKSALKLCSPLAEQSIQEIPEIVSDPYNPPRPGKDDRHHGTDLAYYRRKERTTIEGELVQALSAGRVVAVVQDQLPYGNMVIIATPRSAFPAEMVAQFGIAEGDALYILYAHFLDAPLVSLGEQIACGQPLGAVGATGYNIVNPHLHIETRVGPAERVFLEGMAYYDTRTTEAERHNYELWRTSGTFRHFDPLALINAYLDNMAGE